MGLSNSERIMRVLASALALEEGLNPDNRNLWTDDKYDLRNIQKHVSSIKEVLDELIGLLIQHTDTTGAWWFLGESENGFRALTTEYLSPDETNLTVGLAYREEVMKPGIDDDLTIHDFGRRLGFGMHRKLLDLARWWDLWAYIPSIMYGMNRYEDNAFPSAVRREVNRLSARMLYFRRYLLTDDIAGTDLYQAEKVLLLKYKLYDEAKYTEDFDLDKKCKQLSDLTQDQLNNEIQQLWSEKSKWDAKYHAEQKEKRLEHDPVLGKVAGPTVEALVHDVTTQLREKGCAYTKRKLILRALDYCGSNADDAVDVLYDFTCKKQKHAKRYGYDNVKICKYCGLVVLDQRNKTGYCRDCLPHRKG